MKKIALVYDAIYPYIKGGGEKRFYEIGKRLSQKGYEVHFYGMKFWKGNDIIKNEGMYYHGICKAVPLYNQERRTISQALFFGLSSFKLLKEDFDIIDRCGFPYFSLFGAKLACIVKRKKLYSAWHEVWGKIYWKKYLGKKGIFGYFIEKLASKMPNKIIAVSEGTKNKLRFQLKLNENKVIVIPNGVDFKEIQKVNPCKEKSDIIFVGRLISHKNVDVLIKSIKIIKKSNPNIKCLIVGEGPEKNNLEKLVKDLGLEKNIKFKGFMKNYEDVLALMKSSKVFVLPSTREGFGMVVLESNSLGVSVVTVNHNNNASKSLIGEGMNGFIAEFDVISLAENIKKAIKFDKDMKEDCINYAKNYDWEKITDKFIGVYQ